MAINIKDCSFTHGRVEISAPANADLDIEGTDVSHNHTNMEIRDAPSILAQLGLPENTPPRYVTAALQILHKTHVPVAKREADL